MSEGNNFDVSLNRNLMKPIVCYYLAAVFVIFHKKIMSVLNCLKKSTLP